jgi:transcriptional regulator with XRE-family HTH domain
MRGVIANGEKIVALRKRVGLTQEMLAADAGCDVKTLRRAERSQRLDIASLRRIAARLDVTVQDLIAEKYADRREANLAATWRFLQAFNAHDSGGVAESFCEDGVILIMADPAVPGAGEFRGRDQIRRWAEICFTNFRTDPVTPENSRMDVVGDLVFNRLDRPHLEFLPTGKQANVYLTSEFRIASGLIAELWIYPESGAIERMVLQWQPGVAESQVE